MIDGTDRVRRYFAYGSNMSAAQMEQRCPGACNPVVAVLADHAWLCNERGYATIAPVEGRIVHGVVWDVTADHLVTLDRYEGVAGGIYRRDTITVMCHDGEAIDAVIYVDPRDAPGPPNDGYLERVVDGATEHGLPDDYIGYLRRWADVPRNPQPRRHDREGPQTLTELLAIPGVAEIVELRSSFGFIAIHAGELEQATDVVASLAAALVGLLVLRRHPPGRRRSPSPVDPLPTGRVRCPRPLPRPRRHGHLGARLRPAGDVDLRARRWDEP